MLPLIFAGIANMIFVKTPFCRHYNFPIDGGKLFKDGKRIFGDNKTYIGFLSMIIFSVLFQILMGVVCKWSGTNTLNHLYQHNDNTFLFNLFVGFVIGFLYMISELPNSFIKRRLNIAAGKTERGFVGCLFFVIDQIDSLIPVMLFVNVLSRRNFVSFLVYLFCGFFTHIVINLLLYLMKIRRNI